MKNLKISKKKIGNRLKKLSILVIYFLLICISFIYLEPIFRIISMSFMSLKDLIDPSIEWIPRNLSMDNMVIAAGVLNIKKSLWNSIWFSALLALAQTLVSALTGFAFSRYQFKFKKFWFVMLLVAFILPVPLLMIPRLMLFMSAQNSLGIHFIGTPIPQILMSLLGQGVYSTILILIFYNFFNLIPGSLDEAAMIDGANPFQVFYQIVVKISYSTVLVVFLFSFVWNWNETYVTGTFVRNSIELLPAKLSLFDSAFETYAKAGGNMTSFKINEAYKMAATLLSITPLLLLYSFVQRQFIQGIENTGITGE